MQLEFLRGKKLAARLEVLKTTANQHHAAATGKWREFLEHARQVGAALEEAFQRLGRRWGEWRRNNFKGSRRTASNYRRIAREWNDPRLIQARQDGLRLTSIDAVLRVLQGKAPEPKPRPITAADLADIDRDLFRKDFSAWVDDLRPEERETLYKTFPDYLSGKFHEAVKDATHAMLEYDYDESYAEMMKEVWERSRPPEVRKQRQDAIDAELDRLAVKAVREMGQAGVWRG